jgi:pSer/pThr/pTyr-binding forkhead associated (FHA) protein
MSLDWVLLGFRILTTLIFCVFLGLAFYIIWRDLKSVEAQITLQPQATHQLRVIATAEAEAGPVVGQTLPLPPITHLGRDPENTIVLDDAAVSAVHARLSRENGVWWLEDLGSQHGTCLNEIPLSKPTSLTNGDIIEIGRSRFRLETVS